MESFMKNTEWTFVTQGILLFAFMLGIAFISETQNVLYAEPPCSQCVAAECAIDAVIGGSEEPTTQSPQTPSSYSIKQCELQFSQVW